MRFSKVRTQLKRLMVSLLTAALVATGTLGYYKVVQATENVSVASIISDAYGYGIFVSGSTYISGDSESNICTTHLAYNANIGYSGVGTIYVDGTYQASGSHIRCSNLVLGSAEFTQSNDQWYVNGKFVGNSSQIGRIDRGKYDIQSAMSTILENAVDLHLKGTEATTNSEGKWVFDLESGQNILKVSDVSSFTPKVSITQGNTLIMNITPVGDSITVSGQDVKGMVSHPGQDEASVVVWNFGNYSGTINASNMFGTIIAPNASVVLGGGNLCGRVIAANYTSQSETHFKGSTWYPVIQTTEPPVMTEPPVETTEPPVITTAPPVITTAPPVITTAPPVITTAPPIVTTAPPVITTAPPVITTEPPVITTAPPVITTEPPVVTTAPPVITTEPPVITTAPPVITTEPPVITTTAPPTETPEVLGERREFEIEDPGVPLSDAAVLGSNRRPQTGDASDIWMVAFLASLSGLAAWVLQGRKK